VVGDLQHVGAQVDTTRHDPRLRLGVEVTGEQDANAALGHPDQQAEVVRLGLRSRDLRRRGEHLDGGAADDAAVPGHQRGPLHASRASQRVNAGDPVVGRRQGAGGDHPDAAPVQRTRESGDVVGVEMRQHQQRDVGDAEPPEAAVLQPGVRPDIDEHRLPRCGRHDQRIPLADVARHEIRGRRWPAAQRLPQRPSDDDQPDQRCQRQRAGARESPEQAHAREEQHGEQRSSPRPGGPGRRAVGEFGRPVRDGRQPADRPAGQPRGGVGRGRQQRTQHGGEQSEDGGGRDGGSRQEVRRQRYERHLTGQRGDDRCGGHAGRGTDRDGVGEQARDAARTEPPRPSRRHHDDRRGGGDRQGEAGVGGQRRFGEQQHDHRGAERGNGGPHPSSRQRDQRDPAHHGRPQHARSGLSEQDEAGERQRTHDRLDPPVHRPQAQRPQHAGKDDRHVGTRHGHEVGEPGRPEVRRQHGVERAGVADDQPGQQAGLLGRQGAGGGVHQAVAQAPGDPLRPAGPPQRSRRTAHGHQGGHRVTGRGRRKLAGGAHGPPGEEAPPAVRRCEQHDRVVESGPDAGPLQPEDGRIQDHPASGGRQRPGHAIDAEQEGGGGARSGELHQRRAGVLPGPHRRAGRGRRDCDEQPGEHRGHRCSAPVHGCGQAARRERTGHQSDRRQGWGQRGDQPGRRCGRHESQVETAVPRCAVAGSGSGHTVTEPDSREYSAGPMPGTSSS
jgi:hypothetical protein